MIQRKQRSRDLEIIREIGVRELVHFPLTVNYDAKISRLVDDGKYNFVDSKVRQLIKDDGFWRSTRLGQKTLNIIRIQFGREMFLHDVWDFIQITALRSTGIVELLHWGIAYPQQQLASPIVAPNAITRSGDYLIFLNGDPASGRDLLAQPTKKLLPANVRFLAIDPH